MPKIKLGREQKGPDWEKMSAGFFPNAVPPRRRNFPVEVPLGQCP